MQKAQHHRQRFTIKDSAHLLSKALLYSPLHGLKCAVNDGIYCAALL